MTRRPYSGVKDFQRILASSGSPVIYHRDNSTHICSCLTPEGFRDPIWHIQHPTAPECNEAGMISEKGATIEVKIRGFVQPVQSGAVRRLTTEQVLNLFGEVQTDDHIGLFPVEWAGKALNFFDWGRATEDWVEYNKRRFQVVNANLIPDPISGNPYHHWETGLRLISKP